MITQRIEDPQQLKHIAGDWNRLAGDVPFRNFMWLTTWWKHYGRGRDGLAVLVTRDDNGAVHGIAPCYIKQSLTHGRELRLLGDGEVCSDHLTLLADSNFHAEVSRSVARWLSENRHAWDRLSFESVDASDSTFAILLAALDEAECVARITQAGRYWAIELPPDWDEFLATQSKSHRKQLRQADRRVLSTPRVQWHLVSHLDELQLAWPILVDLHQRRRNSLGEPGCFASSSFTAFHREMCEYFLNTGQLRLSWMELDGAPAAAEYHIASGDTLYGYQGGVDPDRLDEGPGQLSMIACLQAAIAEGRSRCDLLRGDEPYKAHWRAAPYETIDLHAISPRASARIRESAVATASNVARWLVSSWATPSAQSIGNGG